MIDIAFFLNPTRIQSTFFPLFPLFPLEGQEFPPPSLPARVLKINIMGEVSLVGPEFPCSPAPEGIEKWRSCCEVDGNFGEDGF